MPFIIHKKNVYRSQGDSTAEACLVNMSTNHVPVAAASSNHRCPEHIAETMLEVRAVAPGWCIGSEKGKQVA